MSLFEKFLWKLLGERNFKNLRNKYYLFLEKHLPSSWRVVHSQMGEDLILLNLLQSVNTGFYVDVGAFHPIELSNTYLFYKRGWKGINIDATPGTMKMFNILRPDDINLEIGISDKESRMPFYLFEMRALNTFSEKGVEYAKRTFGLDPTKKVMVHFYPLSAILDKYLPDGKNIDFLSIDVEGADEVVLRSNNWEKYKPRVICIEYHGDFEEFQTSELFQFLKNLNYHFAAKTGPSHFFYLAD
ncbi:MAG: FkbM family methyltransferase [Chitinophagaceae bacterium]|nr:FkbM family methyltransferase [Chitinophagaceae bacterium]MCZ2397313.1 FkbM family methyltransferase [Chitinophagales bacterium]